LKYIGGRAIRTRLKARKIKPLPSVRSIERILADSQMTRPQTSQPQIDYPTLAPIRAQQLCQIDHLPHFLQGGLKVYCFNAIDVVSRYPTGQVYSHHRASDACDFLWHVWQTSGIPAYTQVDNEGCFSGGATHPYVLGQCVRLALRVGTQLLFSPVGHPQSNGSVERFHQDYQLYVWQDTYLADQEAVQAQADLFFDRYRHSHHHSTLPDEQTPALVHQQPGPPRLLAATEPLSAGKLPLYAGQVHFMRQVQPDGTVSVLNVAWPVPEPDPLKGVWVTLTLSVAAEATLSIYDAAPDVSTRTCLATYPFPLQEPVLPRPQSGPATSDPQLVAELTPAPDLVETPAANFTFWQWLPVNRPVPQASRQLVRASLQFTSRPCRNNVLTVFWLIMCLACETIY
jgi:transposase InsO family protein